MVNYQVTDYVEKNDLVCFGISGHEVEEWLPEWTPKAKHDIAILASWFPKNKYDEFIVRPASKSDWNWTNYASRGQLRCLLALGVIRELPIKNFYVRSGLTYLWLIFFVSKGLGRGLRY